MSRKWYERRLEPEAFEIFLPSMYFFFWKRQTKGQTNRGGRPGITYAFEKIGNKWICIGLRSFGTVSAWNEQYHRDYPQTSNVHDPPALVHPPALYRFVWYARHHSECFTADQTAIKPKIGLSNDLQMCLLQRWEKLRAGWDAKKKKGSGICSDGHTENRLLDITRENAVQGNRTPNPAPRSGHWKGWLYNSTYHTTTVSLYARLPLVTSCIGCCTIILRESSTFPVLLFPRYPWNYNVWNAW